MACIKKIEVKELTGDLRVSSETFEVLDTKVKQLISQACERAVANGRKTVMPQDL